MAEPTPDERTRSTPGLLNDVIAQISALVRGEMDLARAEVQENATKAAVAVGLIVGAIVLILAALNVLAAAVAAGLTELGIDAGWSALIVGGVLAVIALIMLMKGRNDLKASSLAPTRTTKNVRRDAHAVKESADGR